MVKGIKNVSSTNISFLKDVNERKENTFKNRVMSLNKLQTQTSVMLRSSSKKIPLFE